MTAAIDFALDGGTVRELAFETAVLIEDSRLLELPPTDILFPPEEAEVVLAIGNEQSGPADLRPLEADPEPVEDPSPRASLEALARLHQNLIHEEEIEEQTVAEPAPAVSAPAEEAAAVAAEIVDPPSSDAPAEDTAAETEPAAAEPNEEPAGEPMPGHATELLDVTIRMFPPTKPVPIAGAGLPIQSEPLLPRMKSLPLRPKMSVASGYVPPTAVSQIKTPGSVAKGAPAQVAPSKAAGPVQVAAKSTHPAGPKAAPAAKPAARIVQPPKPAPKAQTPAPAPSKVSTPPVHPETNVPKAEAAESASVQVAVKEPPAMAAPAKAGPQPSKPVAEEPSRENVRPPAKSAPRVVTSDVSVETVPSFGAMQQSGSFAGSLKVKLGIAIVILVVACSTWLGWGGKSGKPAASNSALAADGAGPSIIMGEGGWVEGWAGDPSGIHAGRQITIYRPSLKLSDYRIEFQGTIDTQSIGWVFRAADPQNYYAMKLMEVSSGLKPKLALFKYLVVNGRQTQVGRVPIDLTVGSDTAFHIRTDVRGPQFSTSIQGRQVDVWTDDQLKTGGVGFLNERDERGKVNSVSIRYLNGPVK
jgi:hypothetical protein